MDEEEGRNDVRRKIKRPLSVDMPSFRYGIELAAAVAADYDAYSVHPFLVSECILGKLNLLKGKPRKNKSAEEIDRVIRRIEMKVGNIEIMSRLMAHSSMARRRSVRAQVDEVMRQAKVMAGASWPSADATRWALNKLSGLSK